MSPDDRSRLAQELDKMLGPEYLSFKSGHAYIEAFKVVNLANEIFGFDGWSSEIRHMETDYVDVVNGRINVGISCRTRVTLKSGMWHEDVGYGSSINMPFKYQAFDKARKEASTDALKRALRMFGESVGNCIYNKEYVSMIKKVHAEKPTFDIDDLRRPRKRRRPEKPEPEEPEPEEPEPVWPCDWPGRDAFVETGQLRGPAAEEPEYISDDDEDFPDLPAALASPAAVTADPKVVVPTDILDDGDDPDVTPMPADPIFVTADQAALLRNPATNASPVPRTALFDTAYRSPAQERYSLPQNMTSKILRRPKN